jgi:hypothetical protein
MSENSMSLSVKSRFAAGNSAPEGDSLIYETARIRYSFKE